MSPVRKTTLPDAGLVTNEYYPNGLLKKTYGSRTYPQEYTYDSQGRLKTLKTWQTYASATGAAVTTWNYDPARGWLTGKTYADNTGPTYTYWPSGRTKTRTWARTVAGQPLVTTYNYNNAGDLATIDYSDATADVGFGYDRLGRRTSTTDATGTLVTTYEGLTAATDDETYAAGSPLLPALALNRTRDSLLRPSGLAAEVTSPKVQVTSVGYSYDPNTGRLGTVTAGDLTHTYAYQPQSSLIATLTQKKSGAAVLITTRTYDHLNRLSAITSASVPSLSQSVSAAYQYNSANQRTRLTREDSAYWSYGYDILGQVTAATKHLADATTILGLDQAFTFDDIGNRRTATRDSQSATLSPKTETYTPNLLNQYTQRTVPPAVDIIGAAYSGTTITVNSQPTTRQGERWAAEVSVPNTAAPAYPNIRVVGLNPKQGPNGTDAVAEETRQAFVAKSPELFTYDADGNLTADGRWTYIWDAENRLVSVETQTAAVTAGVPKQKLEFVYDSAGRRLQKKVSNWSGSAYGLVSDTRFLYDGWNLIAEFNVPLGTSNLVLQRSYTWGLDLSGSSQGAGGVGGLLQVSVASPSAFSLFPSYDGNGNVLAAYDSASGTRVAEFEYGPFGETLRATGPAAEAIPFRFSTKYTDSETGLLYFGYRYYCPSTGRWPSRDPIGERGGLNLYGIIGNDVVNQADILGLSGFATAPAPSAPTVELYPPGYYPPGFPGSSDGPAWTTEHLGVGGASITATATAFVVSTALVVVPMDKIIGPPSQLPYDPANVRNAGGGSPEIGNPGELNSQSPQGWVRAYEKGRELQRLRVTLLRQVNERKDECCPTMKVKRSEMPQIAQHIADAQGQGYPYKLHKGMGDEMADSNRDLAMLGLRFGKPVPTGWQRDEYPFASTLEGGPWTSVRLVPKWENSLQATQIRAFLAPLVPLQCFYVQVVP